MKKYIQHHIKNIKTFFYTLVGVNYKTLTLNYKGTEVTLIDINNMSEEQEDEKQKFILKFNEHVETHKDEDFWMTPEEISGATGATETQVIQYVESFDEFVRNSKGEYTTLEEYNKNTDFFRKFLDTYTGKIK